MTGGKSPIGYLKAYMTNLYLSKDPEKVTEAIEEGKQTSLIKTSCKSPDTSPTSNSLTGVYSYLEFDCGSFTPLVEVSTPCCAARRGWLRTACDVWLPAYIRTKQTEV